MTYNWTMTAVRSSASVIRAYRAVVGFTNHAEVLSPCGHDVMRFDQTAGFVLAQQVFGHAVFPRSRLCPRCSALALPQAERRVMGPPQLAMDWGQRLTARERQASLTLLQALLADMPNAPDPAEWNQLSPEQRGVIAQVGEHFAQKFGLMFREWLSLNATAAPLLTAAGLHRLKSSDEVKQQRIETREDRARAKDRARDRR